MLAEERRREILNRVNNSGSVQVTELSSELDVTEETIRRDLKILNDQQLLKRTHGGAIAINNEKSELSFNTRKVKNKQEKNKIAEKAINFINNGETIFLDASTTSLFLARRLINMENITVITNSARIIFELAENKNISIISTGGLLRPNSLSFVGPLANETIYKYHADKLICSCKGISIKHGATDSNELEIEVKKNMVHNSLETIIIADHTKFNEIGLSRFADIEEIDYIITDEIVPDSIKNPFKTHNISIY